MIVSSVGGSCRALSWPFSNSSVRVATASVTEELLFHASVIRTVIQCTPFDFLVLLRNALERVDSPASEQATQTIIRRSQYRYPTFAIPLQSWSLGDWVTLLLPRQATI
jgi:hypothetical protein